MTRLAYTTLAIVIWALASWAFLSAQQDLAELCIVDDFVITYNQTEGR